MIRLPAFSSHDLNWTAELEALKNLPSFLIHLDLGLSVDRLEDSALFQTFSLTLDHFSKTVWPQIQPHCNGIVLFKGPIDTLTDAHIATRFASYLQGLAASLPEEANLYALFDPVPTYSRGKIAHLLSYDRFLHIQTSLTPPDSPHGVLLPPDDLCTADVIYTLDHLLDENPALRIIPEARLNELWHGLDEIIIFEETVSKLGRRQLLGFTAAGGKVRSRGIRTPDPLLPKQLR